MGWGSLWLIGEKSRLRFRGRRTGPRIPGNSRAALPPPAATSAIQSLYIYPAGFVSDFTQCLGLVDIVSYLLGVKPVFAAIWVVVRPLRRLRTRRMTWPVAVGWEAGLGDLGTGFSIVCLSAVGSSRSMPKRVEKPVSFTRITETD